MNPPILDKLQDCVQTSEGLYHRLVMLVGSAGSGKTSTLRDFANKYGSSVVNVNLALSAELLDLTAKQRALRVPDIFNRAMNPAQSPLILDNLEILFDKDLRQDPLRLLQGISRNRTVVASWSGTMDTGRLLYAEPGHPEYRSYDSTDALILLMDGTTVINGQITTGRLN